MISETSARFAHAQRFGFALFGEYAMSEQTGPGDRPTLSIKWTDYASKNLNARIEELKRRDRPFTLDPVVEGIQFLRGVGSRATLMLPALYTLVGSSYLPKVPGELPVWKSTQAASLNFFALQTISLVCRSIFDESRKKNLTGKLFAKASDKTLDAMAEHWSSFSRQPVEDASRALTLLRELFRRCAQPKKSLLEGESLLERRVGLLKYHADRQGAHLSLEPHLVGLIDIVHVVATITMVGAIIVDFDQPCLGPQYFNSLDEAGWSAAKSIFPDLFYESSVSQFRHSRSGETVLGASAIRGSQNVADTTTRSHRVLGQLRRLHREPCRARARLNFAAMISDLRASAVPVPHHAKRLVP
jgi:hypothetical protein